jgi:hypothetical protein
MLDALQRLQAERKVTVIIFVILAALSFIRFHFVEPDEHSYTPVTVGDCTTFTTTYPRVVEIGP